ncbi:MAG TPA: DUF177 domain-containing protein [Bacteroidetes bacterium]|nr:DUF177 domain-containing protein [Bacteroidota bacterium]
MNPFREFDIAFVGLKPGIHHFSFEIDNKFFQLFDQSPVSNAKINVKLEFDKKVNFFLLNFQISGTVHLQCDRCADEIDFPIDADYPLVIKFDEHREEDNDDSNADVMYISRSETLLNVSQLIYEFVVLSIPMGRITCEHVPSKGKCNEEAIKVLTTLNREPEHNPDPRWDKLKKIKTK